MTIHWIDYSALSNGSGTYTSPYNGSTQISGSTTTGDEIRIKSHSLANLTDFTFTATFTTTSSNYSIPYLEVSDASLFTVGDICMYDTHKTCFRVKSLDTSSSPNRIYTGADFSYRPVHAWNVSGGTFRRIDPQYYPNDHHFYLKFASYTNSNSCEVSDGWYSETARVTDKSYMTIIAPHQTSTSNRYLYVLYLGHNSTINLTNTCCVSQWDKDFQVKDVFKQMNNTTMNFHALWGGRWNGGFYSSYSSFGSNNTLIADYMTTYYGFSGSGGWPGVGNTLQVNNHTQYNSYMNTRDNPGANTYIQGYVITRTNGGTLLDYAYSADWDYQFNGRIESANNSSMTSLVFGAKSVTLGLGFGASYGHYNVTHTEQATLTYCIYSNQINNIDNDLTTPPPIINNSTMTVTTPVYIKMYMSGDQFFSKRATANKARIHDATMFYDSNDIYVESSTFFKNSSTLVRDINTAAPLEYEYLSPAYSYSSTNGIKITKDTSFYKTTSPSLKCYLSTFGTVYSDREFVKAIDIPVNGDGSTEFTVTGWVKSDNGMFDTDKLKARVVYDDIANVTVNINISSAEAGWTLFSIAFTPSDKQMAQFQLRMHPQAGARSVWLSDVGVA